VGKCGKLSGIYKIFFTLDKHYAITVRYAGHECFQIVRSHDATLQKGAEFNQ
jgi:hypothetical protein